MIRKQKLQLETKDINLKLFLYNKNIKIKSNNKKKNFLKAIFQ